MLKHEECGEGNGGGVPEEARSGQALPLTSEAPLCRVQLFWPRCTWDLEYLITMSLP